MSFSAGNYGHRLSSSAGNGIFMIFFFLFIPAAMLILMDRKNFKGLFSLGGERGWWDVSLFYVRWF